MAYDKEILNLARARGAKGNRRETLLASTILAMASALVAPGFISTALAQVALPSNGQVVSGQATIETPTDSSVKVTQSSDKAIIDWTNFSIGQGGTVRFDNGNGATLNRVTGTSLSSINGVLSATGSVYLINPNGVIIGQNGVVNVGGNFVASTLNVSNADFLKGGSLTFDGLSSGSVINFGKVGSLGGDVALIANKVDNKGDISATKGTVGLIAGQSVLMRDASVDGGKFLILRGGAGSSVSHSGLISATAAELAAEGGSVYALAGNTDNIERANAVVESDGKVYLATGAKSGGDITVGAEATIDVSSATGNGGSAKIIADMETGHLLFQGRALARGGFGSQGGFVETSGAYVNFNGARVDTSAEGGKTGLWLTDPYDLTVDATAASTISSNLATTNVTLQTTNVGTSGPGTPNASGNGDITINSAISWSSGNMLTLDAYRSININAGITVAGAGGVTLITNNGGSGGDYSFGLSNSGFAGKLSFTGTPGSGQSLNINGDNYNLLYSMGDLASISGSSDRYALATDLSGGSHSDSVVGTFSGNFTGLGHTVSGLTINATATNAAGLIGENSGTVRDIGLTGGTITGAASSGNTGALIGANLGGTVKNAYSTATVTSAGNDVGGLIGKSDNGTVSNVFASGAVTGQNTVGGLIGYTTSGTLSTAHATGDVTQNNNINGGGLIGAASGTAISNVYATGNVNNPNGGAVGGLIGHASGGATVDTAYATGAVNSSNHVGGLVGLLNDSAITNAHATGTVDGEWRLGGLVGTAENSSLSTSYATGNVASSNMGGDMLGGFVGRLTGSTVTDAYATGSVSGPGFNNAVGGFVGYLDTGSSINQGYALGLVTVGAFSGDVGGFTGRAISGSSVSNAYYDYQTTGQAAGVQADGTEGLSTTALQGTLPGGFSNTVWGTAAGYYPYFNSSAPTQKVSGFAYNSNGSAAVGGTVGVYTGGNLLNGATVTTGANGYYYYTVTTGTATSSTKLGAALTLSGDTTASGLTYTDTPTFTGPDVTDLDITSGIFKVNTTDTSYSTLLNNMTATFGSGNYSSLLSDIGSAERRIFAATSFDIDQSISTTGKLLIQANDGAMSIGSGAVVQSTASGDAIVLAANGSFTNNGGASSVVASNGRWLIYSQAHNAPSAAPTLAVTGGLNGKSYYNDAFNFSTSSFATAAGSGNRFVYGYAPTLTISPTTQSLVYNGAAQTDTYAPSGYLSAADQADDSFTGTIAGLTTSAKDVGAYSLTASGTLASDLNYGISYGSGTLTITPKALTASLTGNTTKTYDGNTSASLTGIGYGLTGVIGVDDVAASGTSATYGDKNAGSAKSVTATGLSLSGTDAGNYTVGSSASGNIGNIDKAALTLSAVTDTKTYNGTTASSGTVGVSGIQGTDTVTGLTQTFDAKNAGSRTLNVTGYTVNDGNSGGNYTVTTQTAAGTIGQATLTAGLTGTVTKTYDGTTAATLAGSNYSLGGLIGGDSVTVSGAATYGDKNAGTGKSVNATGLALTGTDAANYTVNATASANIGTIDKAALTASLTGNTTKTYDGNTSATLLGSNYALSGVIGAEDVSVSGASAAYGNKNAGTGKSVTASGLALGGVDAGNYTVNASASANIGTINQAALTATLTGTTSKTYDGTTSATLTNANYSLGGLIGGDSVTVSGTAAYADKHAASGKAVTSTGLALGGTDGGNYTVNSSASANIGTINQASLTIAAATDTKVYDGTTASTAAPTTSGLVAGDTVTGLTQTFDSKNAGVRTITVNGTYTINDGNGGNNYTVAIGALTTAGTITAKALTASLTGNTTKTYDGNTSATLTGANYGLTGVVGTDNVSVSGTSAAYANKNAGTGKAVTASGLALSGTDAANYTVGTTATGNIGTINKAALTIAAVTDTKTYNGTTASSGVATASGLVGGDTVTGLSQTFDSKNAGSRTLSVTGYTVNDGNTGGNYTVTLQTAAGTINKAALTAALTGTATKVYDGTTTATLASGNYGLTGLIGGDAVTVSGTGAYNNKNAGTGKTVTASGLTLAGTDAGNYTVNSSASANIGTITAAALTASLTGNTTKTYDGTTTATLTSGNYALTGVVAGDAVTVSGTSAAYNNKNAGTGKTVTASGIALAGTDAANYTVGTTATGNIGTINKAALTLAATTATKTYNGTTAATGTATASGLVGGDTVTGVTQAFDTKNAGSRTVNVTAYTVNDGNAGGNYAVTLQTAAGTINKAALTAALTGTTTKVYDGTTNATLAAGNYALTGLISGDAVTVSGTAAYADKNAGTAKAVTSTGLTLAGTDGGNYTVNASASANIGTITKAALTVTADPKSKVQGVSDPALTYTVSSGTLFSGDSLTGSLTRAVGENPGTYDITQGTLAASSNYNLTYVKGAFNITPLMLLTTLTLTPATPTEGLTLPETDAPSGGEPCVSSDKCPSHPYPTNQVISSTIRFASK